MPLIDSHCHAWRTWPYEPAVPDPDSRGTVEQLLWEMDQSGVDQAFVVAANIELNPDNNDYVAEAVARHKDRLHHIAHIDCAWEPTYNTDGARDRLDALYETCHPVGITKYFSSEVDDWPLSDEGMAFFERAAELGLILNLAASPEWQPQIGEIARRLPEVPILLHHVGAYRMGSVDEDTAFTLLARTLENHNVYVKLSGFHYGAERFWDFPQHEAVAFVKRLYGVAGGRRFCWGSDYPVGKRDRGFTYPQTIECIRHYCDFIPAGDMPFVLGGTLELLLKQQNRSN